MRQLPIRQLACNALSNWGVIALQLAAAFLLSPLLAHHLGHASYGIWMIVESIIAYLMLFDGGLAAAVVRHVARSRATLNATALNQIVNTSLVLFLVLGGAVGLLGTALAWSPLLPLLRIPPDLLGDSRLILLVLALNLALCLPLHVFTSVIDGTNQTTWKNLIKGGAIIVRSVLFYHLLFLDTKLHHFGVVVLATSVVEHGLLAFLAFRLVPQLRLGLQLASWSTFQEIRSFSFQAFLALVAGRLSFQTDAVVIALCLGPAAITPFSFASRLTEYFKTVIRSATNVLTPAISTLEAHDDYHSIRMVYIYCSRLVLWAVIPFMFFVPLFGETFLLLWLGPELAELTAPLLLILSLPMALCLTQSVAGRILYGLGCLQWFSTAVVIEAIANLGLSLALAPFLGLAGVAWGTTIPNLVFNGLLPGWTCRRLQLSLGQYLAQALLLPLLGSIPLLLTWVGVRSTFPITTWGMLLLVLGSGLLIQAALFALLEIPGWLVRAPALPPTRPATVHPA